MLAKPLPRTIQQPRLSSLARRRPFHTSRPARGNSLLKAATANATRSRALVPYKEPVRALTPYKEPENRLVKVPKVFHAIFGGTAEDEFDTLGGRPTTGKSASTARRLDDLIPNKHTYFVKGPGFGGRDKWLKSENDPDSAIGELLLMLGRNAGELAGGLSHEDIMETLQRTYEQHQASGADKVMLSGFSRGTLTARLFAEYLGQRGVSVDAFNELDPVHVTPDVGDSLKFGEGGKLVHTPQKDARYPSNIRLVNNVRAKDERRLVFDSPAGKAEDPTKTTVVHHDVPGTHGDVGGTEGNFAIRDHIVRRLQPTLDLAGVRTNPLHDPVYGPMRYTEPGMMAKAIRVWAGTKERDPADPNRS